MDIETPVRPVFILCFSRTGSTLLRYILDTHPSVACPPEFHLANIASTLYRGYEMAFNTELTDSASDRQQELCRLVESDCQNMMQNICRSYNSPHWIDKSVITIDHIELLQQVFPNARYICLYRNCLDQMASSMEVLNRDPQGRQYGLDRYLFNARPIVEEGLADYWIDKTASILNVEKQFPNRCFRVQYESVVEQSQATIRALFDFLELDWDSSLLDKVFKVRHKIGSGDHKIQRTQQIHNQSLGRGKHIRRENISPDKIKTINKLHQRLGYKKVKFRKEHSAAFA